MRAKVIFTWFILIGKISLLMNMRPARDSLCLKMGFCRQSPCTSEIRQKGTNARKAFFANDDVISVE